MAGAAFSHCCADLHDVLKATDYDPLIHADREGNLWITIGRMGAEDDNEDVEVMALFCPFCGTQLQTLTTSEYPDSQD